MGIALANSAMLEHAPGQERRAILEAQLGLQRSCHRDQRRLVALRGRGRVVSRELRQALLMALILVLVLVLVLAGIQTRYQRRWEGEESDDVAHEQLCEKRLRR